MSEPSDASALSITYTVTEDDVRAFTKSFLWRRLKLLLIFPVFFILPLCVLGTIIRVGCGYSSVTRQRFTG